MAKGRTIRRAIAGAGLTLVSAGIAAAAFAISRSDGPAMASPIDSQALIGEARQGELTVELPEVAEVRITEARVPGRPIVVIDPGHGGSDPGALGVSGETNEKDLTLALALQLRDQLAERGRVRVALTREDDRALSLEQRAAIARRLGASVYVSLHMDSAPNPLARGATVYSLSDVASDAAAARLAEIENGSGPMSSAHDGSVRAILSDLALRDQMNASAGLAERLVRKSGGRFLLRPQPHQFANFHVLRRTEVPAVLFEAGYISNIEDEALLRTPEHRLQIAEALARSIESDVALRSSR